MTIVDLLTTYAGAAVTHRRDQPELAAVAIAFPDGRRLILMERTYRDGVVVIADPSDDELTTLQTADLWAMWNSSRPARVAGIGVMHRGYSSRSSALRSSPSRGDASSRT